MFIDQSTSAFTLPSALFEPTGRRSIARWPSETDLPAQHDYEFGALGYRSFNTLGLDGGAKAGTRLLLDQPFESRATELEGGTQGPNVESILRKFAELGEKVKEARSQVDRRLQELYIDARLNAEPFSEPSLSDLRTCLDWLRSAERPAIFLLDDGNLRAVWRNTVKEQVGLRFLGHGRIQYVIFAQRGNPPQMTQSVGIDTAENIRIRITNEGCDHLLFG